MSPEMIKTVDKMSAVKAVWAPAGPKKDAALKHYEAAERAYSAKNYAETYKELETATHLLA